MFENQNFELKFCNVSVFELKKLKHAKFFKKSFETSEILKQKFHNMSDFELKILKRLRLCEKLIYF